MRAPHWLGVAVLLIVGYAVGVMYPAWGHKLGLK